jgi:hypothetical protein
MFRKTTALTAQKKYPRLRISMIACGFFGFLLSKKSGGEFGNTGTINITGSTVIADEIGIGNGRTATGH